MRSPPIPCEQALQVARLDAERAYGDLSPFRVIISLEKDGWHVDYELKDPQRNGGSPHFIIDPISGKITWKQYQQ